MNVIQTVPNRLVQWSPLGQLKYSAGSSLNTILFVKNLSEMVILFHIEKWLTENLMSITVLYLKNQNV